MEVVGLGKKERKERKKERKKEKRKKAPQSNVSGDGSRRACYCYTL